MKEAFVGGYVIDGTPDMKPVRSDVLVEDGKIVFVGKAKRKQLEGYKKINCKGRYIVPGLINMHLHLFGTGKPSKVMGGGGLQKLVVRFVHTPLGHKVVDRISEKSARDELYSGATTIRTCGDFVESDIRTRDRINRGEIDGPRMYVSGNAITSPGGHGEGLISLIGETPEEYRKHVRDNKEKGVDYIKIMATGGVMDATEPGSPGEVKMSEEDIKAVCDEAHRLGMRVASHTESPAGMEVAIRGGVDTIEHGAGFDEKLGKILKDRDGGVVCTCSPAFPMAKMPPEITKLNDMCVYNSEVVTKGMIDGTKCANKYGIPVGLGTDGSCPYAMHNGMWREVYYYKLLAGVSNEEALNAATLKNAQIWKIDDITGSIEPGKYADMIILKSNPLKNLRALSKPQAVVKEGKIYKNKPSINRTVERRLDKLTDELEAEQNK